MDTWREIDRQRDMQAGRQSQLVRQINRNNHRQTNRQTERDTQTYTQTRQQKDKLAKKKRKTLLIQITINLNAKHNKFVCVHTHKKNANTSQLYTHIKEKYAFIQKYCCE